MAKKYEVLDFWSLKAQKEGYPARSVYKLKEIDEKFKLIDVSRNTLFKVIDLGAAPGSWSLYVLRKFSGMTNQKNRCRATGFVGSVKEIDLGSNTFQNAAEQQGIRPSPTNKFLVSVDLSVLSRQHDKGLFDGENFFFMQGDITLAENRETLLSKGPFNLVISDAAPSTTGNRSVDTLRSLALVEEILVYAELGLAKGGNMVVKVFQGGDTASILKRMRELFTTAKSFKPEACRAESFETYYIGIDKK
jgi:23S rRNA (uridine2552-2'-O)-methyltransferase